jgi:ribokinase
MNPNDPTPANQVLVLGDVNVDVLARLEAPLRVGGDSMSPELKLHLGGVGANTAVALARLGLPARLMGMVGQDWFGDFALSVLEAEGVDTSSVQRTERSPTGLVFVAVEPGGQRTMFGSRGANREVALPEDKQAYWDGVAALHVVGYAFLSPAGDTTARGLLSEASTRGLPASLDVGNDPSRLARKAILQVAERLDILIAAFDEAAALTGLAEVHSIVEALEQRGARQVVLKRSAQGCWVRDQGELRNAPAFPVEVVDTTGAGDVFTAALLRARLDGWPWAEAAVFANAAGGLASAVVGAGEQAPRLGAVKRLLETSPLPREWDSVRVQVLERLS